MNGIEIQLNGEKRVTTSTSVEELLQELGLGGRKIAVERNKDIVSRTSYASTALTSGDKLEIIHFVGGG